MNQLIIDNHVIKKDIKSILYELRPYITPGKLKSITYKADDVHVTCPVHKDGLENKPSCGIYVGDSDDITWGTVHCFACGFKGQLYDFIAECCDQSQWWGKEWLKEHFTETVLDGKEVLIDEPIVLKPQTKKKKFVDENILSTYQTWHPYLEKRKLSKEVCEKFEVKYDPNTECVVFPVRDINGNLTFLTRRSVNSKKIHHRQIGGQRRLFTLQYHKGRNKRGLCLRIPNQRVDFVELGLSRRCFVGHGK